MSSGPTSGGSVDSLVRGATDGDAAAWDALVDRYAPLVWNVARGFRLAADDAADVSQTVWLRLVETLGRLREPAAIPGWLVTTTRRECLRVLRLQGRELPGDTVQLADTVASDAPSPELVAVSADERAEVWRALSHLPARCQVLLRALAWSPDASYAQIAAALDMPIGSIGPTRARCLDRMRRQLGDATSVPQQHRGAGS